MKLELGPANSRTAGLVREVGSRGQWRHPTTEDRITLLEQRVELLEAERQVGGEGKDAP